MVDAYWRRGKQATIEFIESRVIEATNGTYAWLTKHSEQTQERLIKFAIPWGAKLSKLNRAKRAEIKERQLQKQVLLGQQRDAKERRALKKEVIDAIKKVDSSILFEHPLAEGKSDSTLDIMASMLEGDDLRGLILQHVWEDVAGEDVVWRGIVQKTTKKKQRQQYTFSYIIAYWVPADGDTTVPTTFLEDNISVVEAAELIVDFLTGDCSVPPLAPN